MMMTESTYQALLDLIRQIDETTGGKFKIDPAGDWADEDKADED